jgi:hypothetical protein
MTALLLFHARTGARVTMRTAAPLFSAIVAVLIMCGSPAEALRAVAKEAYSIPRLNSGPIFIAALAFVLCAWGARRLAAGLNQWFRSLPVSSAASRRGLLLGLLVVELPVVFALTLLALVVISERWPLIRAAGATAALPPLRWTVVLAASAIFALPVQRAKLTRTCALVAAAMALFGRWWYLIPAVLLLALGEECAGSIRTVPARQPWSSTRFPLTARIAWRALRLKTVTAVLPGLAALAAGWFFITNNALSAARTAGAARFSGTLACALCLASLARSLAVRRPPWPWSRSLPWSSMDRVIQDASFLAIHAVPLATAVSLRSATAAVQVLLAIPLLSLRAVDHMRRLPARRHGMSLFLLEGLIDAMLLALVPGAALLFLAGVVPALYLARHSESHQGVGDWGEIHHAAAGDTFVGRDE